jgi:hypothetical protein
VGLHSQMDPNKSKRTFQRLVTRQMFENQSDLELDIQSSEEKTAKFRFAK